MPGNQAPIDTRDMIGLHSAFRRALRDAPGQIASVGEEDTAAVGRLADYLAEVFWLLHAHHVGEDALLYPLLVERAPEHRDLFDRMDAQHVEVTASLEYAEEALHRYRTSGSSADARALADACEALLVATEPHLTDEEVMVLPIAADLISPPEWGAMPGHALGSYSGTRIWLPFGLALEGMPEDIREDLLAHLPPPVTAMWFGGGADAFAGEMTAIRGTA